MCFHVLLAVLCSTIVYSILLSHGVMNQTIILAQLYRIIIILAQLYRVIYYYNNCFTDTLTYREDIKSFLYNVSRDCVLKVTFD